MKKQSSEKGSGFPECRNLLRPTAKAASPESGSRSPQPLWPSSCSYSSFLPLPALPPFSLSLLFLIFTPHQLILLGLGLQGMDGAEEAVEFTAFPSLRSRPRTRSDASLQFQKTGSFPERCFHLPPAVSHYSPSSPDLLLTVMLFLISRRTTEVEHLFPAAVWGSCQVSDSMRVKGPLTCF